MKKGLVLLGVFTLVACVPSQTSSTPKGIDVDKGFLGMIKNISIEGKLNYAKSEKPSEEFARFLNAYRNSIEETFKALGVDYKKSIKFNCDSASNYVWVSGEKISNLKQYFDESRFDLSNNLYSTSYISELYNGTEFDGYAIPSNVVVLEVVDPSERLSSGVPHYVVFSSENKNTVKSEVCDISWSRK